MATSIEKAQQRVKDLEDKLKQAKALKQKAEARVKTAEAKQKRADDTRRKILVGAAILSKVERGEWPKDKMLEMMGQQLTRPDDRALFGCLQQPHRPSNDDAGRQGAPRSPDARQPPHRGLRAGRRRQAAPSGVHRRHGHAR